MMHMSQRMVCRISVGSAVGRTAGGAVLCNYFLVEEPTLGLLRSPVQSGYWQAYSRSCIIAHETDIRGHGVAI